MNSKSVKCYWLPMYDKHCSVGLNLFLHERSATFHHARLLLSVTDKQQLNCQSLWAQFYDIILILYCSRDDCFAVRSCAAAAERRDALQRWRGRATIRRRRWPVRRVEWSWRYYNVHISAPWKLTGNSLDKQDTKSSMSPACPWHTDGSIIKMKLLISCDCATEWLF